MARWRKSKIFCHRCTQIHTDQAGSATASSLFAPTGILIRKEKIQANVGKTNDQTFLLDSSPSFSSLPFVQKEFETEGRKGNEGMRRKLTSNVNPIALEFRVFSVTYLMRDSVQKKRQTQFLETPVVSSGPARSVHLRLFILLFKARSFKRQPSRQPSPLRWESEGFRPQDPAHECRPDRRS